MPSAPATPRRALRAPHRHLAVRILLAALAFGLYVYAAVPLLAWHESHDRNDVQAAVIVLALWISTALASRPKTRIEKKIQAQMTSSE